MYSVKYANCYKFTIINKILAELLADKNDSNYQIYSRSIIIHFVLTKANSIETDLILEEVPEFDLTRKIRLMKY